LTLLPALDVASLQLDELAHDRYLYLPSVGFVLLAAIAIRRIRFGTARVFGVPAVQAVCVLLIAAAMAVGVVQQSVFWANDLLLYYRAAKIAPQSTSALLGLGDALLARNYLDEGIRVHEQMVRRNPYLWHSRAQLGNAYYKQGRYRESEQQLLEAARLSPGIPQLWIYLAVAQLKNQRYPEAEFSMRHAIAAQPSAAGQHYMLGVALEQQRRWPEAVAAFEQELALAPDQPKVRAELESARSHLR
jgi:protein O-mannosyl-transferase